MYYDFLNRQQALPDSNKTLFSIIGVDQMLREKYAKRTEQVLEKTIFNSRWLLALFYLGLVIGIILLFIKFDQELWHMMTHVFGASETDVIVGILALIDISLVASLLLIIIFSGYEIFVSKIDTTDHEERPQWMGKLISRA